MKLIIRIALLCLFAAPLAAHAQQNFPPETRNAALRYWIAFAEIKDPPSDKATQDLLEKTVAGDAPWDEAKLGPILDLNADAIAIFQRATKLPDCDWGLEYSQGSRASIAYTPRARVISRLNTLQGIRDISKGNSQAAVDAWLAGIRFAGQLSRGGPLIFALIAKSALLPNLHAMTAEAKQGHLNTSQKQQIAAALKSAPEDGFDWSAVWGIETETTVNILEDLRKSADPRKTYEELMGQPAPQKGLPPTLQEIQAYRAYMSKVQAALRLPPVQTKTALDSIASDALRLTEPQRNLIPSPQKVNAARVDIYAARQTLQAALNEK